MKTTHANLLTAILLLGTVMANATQHGGLKKTEKTRHDSGRQMEAPATDTMQMPVKKAVLYSVSHDTNTCMFVQEVHIFNVGGRMKAAISYVPEPAASQAGYMGFKVGDKVKWGSPVDQKMIQETGSNQYLTGTVSLLGKDVCYIEIDNSKLVAVKPYEDIVKVNP